MAALGRYPFNTKADMLTEVINGHTVKLYDTIEELPVVNFQRFNRYALIDAQIGSDLEDVDVKLTRIAKFIGLGDKVNAVEELNNLRQNLYFIQTGVSPKHYSFVAFIAELDGEKVTDLTDDGVKAIYAKLNEVPAGWIERMYERLKKKSRLN